MPTHPRGGDAKGDGGQAGHVSLINPSDDTKVGVTWDVDSVQESVDVDQLKAL